jgi:hypothetical protein
VSHSTLGSREIKKYPESGGHAQGLVELLPLKT